MFVLFSLHVFVVTKMLLYYNIYTKKNSNGGHWKNGRRRKERRKQGGYTRMGEVLNGTDEKPSGTVNTSGGNEQRANSGSSSSTDTRGGRIDNGGRADSGGNTRGTAEEKVVPKLVVVGEPLTEEQKKAERNRLRRERYAQQKAENGQTVKPRKVGKGKKPETNFSNFSIEQLNAIIVSTSAVIATRPNCSHWLITEAEAASITKPLVAMIAESEKLEVIAKNSNQIALAIACITIFAPRLFITVQQMNKSPKKEIQQNVRPEIKQTERSDKTDNKINDGNTSVTDSDNGLLLSWDD